MSEEKVILVTGGAGFIGSHTVIELVRNGFIPVIVDDFRNSDEFILKGIEQIVKRKIQIHRIDLGNYDALKKVFEIHRFLGVIHFAAYKAVGESVDDPIKYYRNNLNSLMNVAELAIVNNVDNFIFSSSCTLYEVPASNLAVSEDTPVGIPDSPYASTKAMGERILSDLVKSNGKLKVLSMRYFNPIGAHESGKIGELPQGKPNNLVPFITQTAMGKLPELTVFGNDYNTIDGTCVRDYVHVSDIAEAHIVGLQWLMKQSHGTEEIVNIGTGHGMSVLQIIELFEDVSGEKLNWKLGARRDGDKEQIFANAEKAKRLLQWDSKRSIKDALRDAWNWELQLENQKQKILIEN